MCTSDIKPSQNNSYLVSSKADGNSTSAKYSSNSLRDVSYSSRAPDALFFFMTAFSTLPAEAAKAFHFCTDGRLSGAVELLRLNAFDSKYPAEEKSFQNPASMLSGLKKALAADKSEFSSEDDNAIYEVTPLVTRSL